MEKWNQTVNQLKPNCLTKLPTSYFIFHGKIALQPINYVAENAAKMLVAKMFAAKKLREEIPDMPENYLFIMHLFSSQRSATLPQAIHLNIEWHDKKKLLYLLRVWLLQSSEEKNAVSCQYQE